MRGWFRSLRWRRRPAPPLPKQMDAGEAIIISKSEHTEESWARLTNRERAEIRWRIRA